MMEQSQKETAMLRPYLSAGNLLRVLAVSIAYFVAARAGLLLAFENSNATPVWPPSGIALAALLLLGYRCWPGITLGAIAANIYVFISNDAASLSTDIFTSAVIGTGNTLEALLGYALVNNGKEPYLSKAGHVHRFALAALFMCLAGAAIGPLAVCASGISPWSSYGTVALTWWTGDVAGVLVFTPLFLAWSRLPEWKGGMKQALEGALLLTGLFLVCFSSFMGWVASSSELPLSYFIIPFLLWATLRFGTHGATTVIAIWALIAVNGTINGYGPFNTPTLNLSLLSLDGYVCVISITFLTLAANMEEHYRVTAKLRETRNELVSLIQHRTQELMSTRTEIMDYQKRIEDIQEVLLKNTILDFSKRALISGTGDELDAIAVGLNTMSEELEDHIRRIRESEERFRILVKNIKDYAIYTVDTEGRVTSWNKGAELIKGYAEGEILGKHIRIFYPEEAQVRGLPAKDLRMAEELGRAEDEGWRQRKDGSRFWANVVITSMRDETGKLRGFVKVTRDITENKEAREHILSLNEQLKQNVERLEEVNKELEAFTYSVSHDLRAPLRAIHGYTRLLWEEYEKQPDSEKKRMMSTVMRNARKMGQLIDDLLALSRLGRKEMQRSHVNMNNLAEGVIQEMKAQSPGADVKIVLHPLPPADADPNLLGQVLTNLLSNAFKYSSRVEKPEVEIGSFKEENEVVYFIRDNGVGFDMKYYDKLFGVFQRLHPTGDFEGTGVGLALVKRIIVRHGGRVWARGESGKGATFFFTLKKESQ